MNKTAKWFTWLATGLPALLVASTLTFVGIKTWQSCTKPPRPPEDIGSARLLRQRALELGCTQVRAAAGEPDPNHVMFDCEKWLPASCNCRLAMTFMATVRDARDEPRVTYVGVGLEECPSGVGYDEVFSLLDPLIPEDHRAAFHDFATTPRQVLTPEQRESFELVQSRDLGFLRVGVTFGAGATNPMTAIGVGPTAEHRAEEVRMQPGRTALPKPCPPPPPRAP